MTERALLELLLLWSLLLGPLGTHRVFLPERRRLWAVAHGVALAVVALGRLLPAPWLCVGWLLFTAGSFAGFLHRRRAELRSPGTLAACVPLLFSNVAAVWLVGGANDLGILGYGRAFSDYAALHGNVLGWILVGALAVLANRPGPYRRLHLAAVFVCFASFLLVALGIDQLRALKPLGVVGLTLAIPTAQLLFLREAWPHHKPAFALGLVSLLGLAYTMLLAWRNELGLLPAAPALGVRGMVSVHGVLNALVVAPSFLLAVALSRPRGGETGDPAPASHLVPRERTLRPGDR